MAAALRIVTAIAMGSAAAAPVCASPDRNDELARSYAYTFSGSFEAERHCPGLETDFQRLIVLRQEAHLGGDTDDRAFLKAIFDRLRPEMEQEIAAKGARAWCATAYAAFGPQGSRTVRRR